MTVKIGLLREARDETMVALTPDGVSRLKRLESVEVLFEPGAGEAAGWSDADYQSVGATVTPIDNLLKVSDLLVTVAGREYRDLPSIRSGTVLIGLLKPLTAPIDPFTQLANVGVTALSLDALPRTSRAQSMDVLSSLSTVAGYRAMVLAAERLKKFLPLLMTAAGTIAPARVLVLGAGVAGLQAIATAHRLGARVHAFDTRPEVREQVESLGASFLTLDVTADSAADGYGTDLDESQHQRELDRLREPVSLADAIITTAQIPGQQAPVLITQAMIEAMSPGSVIIDLAAESGGNTALTRVGEEIVHHGIRIIGVRNIASELPRDASQLYSRNLVNYLTFLHESHIQWDSSHHVSLPDDELVRRTIIVHNGTIHHEGLQLR